MGQSQTPSEGRDRFIVYIPRRCLVMEVGAINYFLLSEAEQDMVDAAMARLLRSLTRTLTVHVQSRYLDAGEVLAHYRETRDQIPEGPLAEYTRHLMQHMEKRMTGSGVTMRCAYLAQEGAFKMARPYGAGTVWQNCRRNFDLYSAITLMPFYQADLFHPGGILLGRNWLTDGPLFYNPFLVRPYLTNHNIFIEGYSGTGKSTGLKVMGARETPLGVKRVQFDIEDEFEEITSAVGGVNLRVTPGDFVANPFDLEVDQDRQGRYILNLLEKVADCKGQIVAMIETAYPDTRLTPLELSVLEDAIRQEYLARGIVDREPTSLFEEGVKKESTSICPGWRANISGPWCCMRSRPWCGKGSSSGSHGRGRRSL